MTSYDFDFLTNSQDANKQAVLLAKIRYNEQLAPFVSSPNATDQEARLRYASDHIERIIDECCEVTHADREVVSGRLKQIIAKEVATTQPQVRNVTEQKGGESEPGNFGDNIAGNAVHTDILDREAVLEDEILEPDAQIEADTPLSEGEVQWPKVANEDWDTGEVENWFNNDEGLYEQAQQAARYNDDASDLGESLQAIWEEYRPAQVDEDAVDWEEVAQGFLAISSVKVACVRCDGECDGEGPVCTECGNFLAKKADYGYGQQAPIGQVPVQGQPVTQAPQQPVNNQQMKCPTCGFVGNAAQVQDHYEKMVAANDQLHMNAQPAGNQQAQPGQVQAKTGKYQYIHKQGDKWVIVQKGTGKVLSHHDSEEQAIAAFKAMMSNKYGAQEDDQDFLAQPHNHGQEEQAEGEPVHEDHQEQDESKDPTDRLDEVVQDFADHAAAKRYSQAEDDEVQQIADRYGVSPEDVKKHLHVIALFGDYTGLNGDIVNDDPSTEGLTEINDADLGGQTEAHEALVPMDKAVEKVAEGLKMQLQDTYDRLQEGFGGEDLPDEYHASVEGQRNFYLPSNMVSATDEDTQEQPMQTAQPQQTQQVPQNTGQTPR